MDELFQFHASLVSRVAAGIAARIPRHVPHEDLISWGIDGLIDAANRFDPTKATFRTYAKHRIRGAILDGLRSLDPVSRDDRSQLRSIEGAKARLTLALGREPDDEETACELGFALPAWHAMRSHLANVGLMPDTARPCLDIDRLPSTLAGGYDSTLSAEIRSMLDRAIATLPARYQAVILLYYRCGLTMRQIAARLGVNESRVSQIHHMALGRLRRELQ